MTAAHAAYRAAAPPLPETPQGRDEIILAELPQVYFIAARIHERLPASVQIEDLVNAGVVGLIEAYNSFDHTRKAQFRTFARFRIRGAILDSLRVLDWGSRSLRRRAREIAETSHRLENSLGRKPSNEEIAAEMHIPLEQIEMALTQLDNLQIVNQQTASSFDGEELYDLIESAPSLQESAYDIFVRNERRAQLAQAIGELTEREQLVLSLYYREDLTMKQVAEVIGIALSRVSQIHSAAIGKLRAALAPLQSARPARQVEGGV
jgi:RNA polymerase sigma factor for flagellar operon FliA